MILLQRPDYVAQYCSTRLFMFLARALPLPTALRLGEWAGRHMVFWTRKSFERATDNLMNAFPSMTSSEAAALALRVYAHFGRASVEMARAKRLLRKSTWREHVVVRNEHFLREVIAAGKGAIFVTAHLGVWEMFGLLLRYYGVRLVSVYRPMKNQLLDRLARRERSDLGQVMIPTDGAMSTLLRVLRGGGYIALVADQHAKRDGIWTPFFGRLASTTPAPALLALRTGAPIVTGYLRRLPGEYRFEAFCDEPIFARPCGDREAEVRRIARELSRRFESYIRMCPDQWLWMHRRWRTPPPGVETA